MQEELLIFIESIDDGFVMRLFQLYMFTPSNIFELVNQYCSLLYKIFTIYVFFLLLVWKGAYFYFDIVSLFSQELYLRFISSLCIKLFSL